MTGQKMDVTSVGAARTARALTPSGYHPNPKWLAFNLRSICRTGHSVVA